MKQFLRLLTVLFSLLVVCFFTSCGSGTSSRQEKSIDGTYVYQDNISRSVVTIYEGYWEMNTQFGAPGSYGSDAKYDSGDVKGDILYHSGFIEYGKVSGKTLRLAGRSYQKQ